jgi:hypothetical protein
MAGELGEADIFSLSFPSNPDDALEMEAPVPCDGESVDGGSRRLAKDGV